MKFRSRQSEPGSNGLMLRASRRPGVVILEFILALPLLIILLLAVIEFTLIYQVNQQVASASKFGAKLASEVSRKWNDTVNLGNFNMPDSGSPVSSPLKSQIDRSLQAYRLRNSLLPPADQLANPSCGVVLKHTACSIPNWTQSTPDSSIAASCQCQAPPDPPTVPDGPERAPSGQDTAYVQVTVAVPLKGNVPDLLSSFGFSLGKRACVQTTTMRLEPNNTPPTAEIEGTLNGALPPNFTVNPMQSQFPIKCGDTLALRNQLGNPPPNGQVVTITFNGEVSQDAEELSSTLNYHWEVTSSLIMPPVHLTGNSPQVDFELPVPPDPNVDGNVTEGPNVGVYRITLTVTDNCGRSSSCFTTVRINTSDSDPG